jgi:outer membrane receptor protein involved in Fe transport
MLQPGCLALASIGAIPFMVGPAMAQSNGNSDAETVVVTGTHIQLNGNEAPTPVTVVSADQLQATTPSSIPEGLDKLPIFMAGSTPNNATTGANGRGGNAPGYFLNLRDLGTIRTLILEDGHRVPGTFYDTTVDTDMLPQMLIQRVDVVTGGASAVYGSDAVSGVVNFILDKKFEGLKGIMQGGISEYGDAKNFRLGVAGGEDIGEHGHLIWSIEYKDRDAIPDAASRPFGNLGASIVGSKPTGAVGTAANPYTLVYGIRQNNVAPGGLITSGPGAGMQFLSNGSLAPFNPGAYTGTANFSVGGDGGIEHNEYLLPVSDTGQGFAHYDYDFNGNITGYVEARYSQARSYEAGQIFTNVTGTNSTTGVYSPGSSAQYPVTIYSGNAFLTAAEQAQLFPGAPANCTGYASCPSFQMARMDNDLMSRLALQQHTTATDFSAGLNGTAFGGYAWDTYYTHGETATKLTTFNNLNADRFYAAIDAVKDPATGNIVCNVSLYAPGAFPGCVPLNLFGQSGTTINGSNASQAALNYVGGTTGWRAHNGLDDFGANITGTAFDDWAGPVKVAAGAEYRLASLQVTTTNPTNVFNPQYLRLAPYGTYPAGNNGTAATNPVGSYPLSNLSYFKELQAGGEGSENVSEASIEVNAPLLKDLPGVQLLSFNGAARYTQYNVGGIDPTGNGVTKTNASFDATTWKLGGEWEVYDDLRIRASRSRDIRAPTLWDLFQGPLTSTSGQLDPLTNVSGSLNTSTVGNPHLKPEVAHNTTAGGVLTPSWLPGFSLSVDYFHIIIDNEIAGVNGLNPVILNPCTATNGAAPNCNLVVRPLGYTNTSAANFPTLVYTANLNVQKQWSEGIDFEANYQTDLSSWSDLNGMVDLRLLWTHTPSLKTRSLPGAVVTNQAGAAAAPGSSLPEDRGALTVDYSDNGLSVDILERYYSDLRQNANATIIYDIPNLPAYFVTDLNLSYDFVTEDVPFTAFVNISNLFDKKPDVLQASGYTGSPGMNYPVVNYEDIIGRAYTVGLKFKM